MSCAYRDSSRAALKGFDPDGADAAAVGKRKRIVANDHSWSREIKRDLSVGKGSVAAEFVHDFELQPGRVSPISN